MPANDGKASAQPDPLARFLDQTTCLDCLEGLKQLPGESVHLVVTDPPYFIDGMGEDWDKTRLERSAARAGVVASLPVGMKFDPRQGRAFERFMAAVAAEVYRVLKPGAFFVAFSQARLYHRLASAAEDAGFEIRDMLGWVYEGQAKAFSMDHFVARSARYAPAERAAILAALGGRKTPQLKPCIEPMVLAQKPRAGTFVENWLAHETGLVDVAQSLDGKFPANLMAVPKPTRQEKGRDNAHLTVKPVRLMEHLIRLFSKEGQVVLDPFMGSGTTAVAALRAARRYVGFELEPEYARTARGRAAAALAGSRQATQ